MDTRVNDEIDFQELAVGIIRYLKSNYKFISLAIITALVAAIVYIVTTKKEYESRMIISTDLLTENMSEQVNDRLSNLAKGSASILARQLGISESEASQITGLEIEFLETIRSQTPTLTSDENLFIVTATMLSKDLIPHLQTGLIFFLEQNDFIQIRIRQREDKYKTLIAKIDKDMRVMDSLKQRLLDGRPVASKNSEMILIDAGTVFTEMIELKREQIIYKDALELSKSFKVIRDFESDEKPAKPKTLYFLIGAFLAGLFLAIGILTLRHLLRLAAA
jgi:uncharacterized protein involved in exopolysaccharide biosynthesis